MYIDRLLFPIYTLGPGNRIVIWTKGCTKRCKNCSNPELWNIEKSKNRDIKDLFQLILNISKENQIDGITFTGGDPIEQFDELIEFIFLVAIPSEIETKMESELLEVYDDIFRVAGESSLKEALRGVNTEAEFLSFSESKGVF